MNHNLPPLDASGTVVIIGGGQAGSDVAFELRRNKFGGRIVLLCEERHLPYQRPPLSKAMLTREMPASTLTLKTAAAYDKAGIEVRLGTKVTAIDRLAKSVRIEDGSVLGYDRLALATGGTARRLRVPNAGLDNIFYLRTIEDGEALRAACAPGKRLVIVGGGYVGLEVASATRKQGLEVTVLESADRVLARVASPEISAFYQQVHCVEGVAIRADSTVVSFQGSDAGAVSGVQCGDGEILSADLVLVGIGLIPNTSLAEQCGLQVDDGIVVDAECRTADHAIVAAGDCVRFHSTFLERWVRLESVPNAIEQAKTAAAAMLDLDRAYVAAPWFWSDQYALKLQMVGIAQGYDQAVIRGSFADRSFVQFYLRKGTIVGADSVDRPAEFMVTRKLVEARAVIEPRILSDESKSLGALL